VKRVTAFRAIVLFVFCAILAGPGTSLNASAETTEFQVKAAFVYNFIKFVQWPPESFVTTSSPISICVFGRDPLEEALYSLEGKSAQGRGLSVRRISGLGEADRCQVLYLGRSEREMVGNILKGLKVGMLTIGDMQPFADSGGMINFVMVDNRVSFEINVEAAEKARLKISSQLLRLARIVKAGSGKEER
jgi:hypothetical protein